MANSRKLLERLKRQLFPFVGAFAIATLLAGCGKSGSSETADADADEAPEAAEPQSEDKAEVAAIEATHTTVELVLPGSEPLEKLRYKFNGQAKENLIMEMGMAMAMEMGGMKQPETQLPTTRMTMAVNGNGLTKDGDLSYSFELTKVDILPKPGVNPMLLNTMKEPMNRLVGMSGSAVITPRGFTRDISVKLPPTAGPELQQQLGSMKQSLNQMATPLPEEAVGIGAKWKVSMPITMPELKINQTATYTLKKIDGDTVTFGVEITQSAPRQKMNIPMAGAEVIMESMNSTGSGSMSLELDKIVPVDSSLSLKSETQISSNGQKIKNSMRMEMKIHP